MADVLSIEQAHSWNITRIAEAFEVSRPTVRKRLREAGVEPCGKRGGTPIYKLADVGPALFQGDGIKTKVDYTPDELDPKSRKEWFQSENERLKFQEKTGELIPEGNYRVDLYETLKAVVGFFESLPDKMERRGIFTPEQLERLETECDNYRNQLHAQLIEVEPEDDSS